MRKERSVMCRNHMHAPCPTSPSLELYRCIEQNEGSEKDIEYVFNCLRDGYGRGDQRNWVL